MDNFLYSGFSFSKEENELKLKYMLFNLLLSFNITIVFLVSIVRLTQNEYIQAIFDISYSILGMITLILARKYRNKFDILIKFTMIFSLIIVTAIFYIELKNLIGVSWFIIQLMVMIYLTDKKFSYFILSIITVTIAYIGLSNGYTTYNVIYSLIPIYISLVFLLFYEKRNELSRKKLEDLTINLEKRVQEEILKNKTKDKLLAKQAKYAALGDMMDAIAHQWKQPIGVISLEAQSMELHAELGNKIENQDIINSANRVEKQISHLNETIDQFRSFLRPNQEKKSENINVMINDVLKLMRSKLIEYKVNTKIIIDENIEIVCNKSEFKHVFINLINNSIEAFSDNNISNRSISFKIEQNINTTIITISDNAGGIPKNIIERIFESNFTTKYYGTGVGLYLIKQIIEKNNFNIDVSNTLDGTTFKIEI